ncbi:hypothetical protein B7P43_G10117, partial [Cryptotermes secundus]
VLRKRLHLKAYKLSIIQHLTDADKMVRKEFCMQIGKVNTHNYRIWGSENPRVSLEHVRDSPKVNVFCALSKERVYGPFFMERTITGIVYLDMLQEFLIPQLDEDDQEGRIHFQQDGASPHYLGEVHEYLNTCFPGQWIGRAAPIAWPPRPPDLNPMDFFLWGFVKDRVFVQPLPANVVELRTRITASVAEVTPEMLRSVWQETDCRWDVCRITNGSHTEP